MGNLLQAVSEVVGPLESTQRQSKRRRVRFEDAEEEDEFSDHASDSKDENDFVGSDTSISEEEDNDLDPDDEREYLEDQQEEQGHVNGHAEDQRHVQLQMEEHEDDEDVANVPPFIRRPGRADAIMKVTEPQQADQVGGQPPQADANEVKLDGQQVPQAEAFQGQPQVDASQQHPPADHVHQQQPQVDVQIRQSTVNSSDCTPQTIVVQPHVPSTSQIKVFSRKRRMTRLRSPPPKEEIVDLDSLESVGVDKNPRADDETTTELFLVHNLSSSEDEEDDCSIVDIKTANHTPFSVPRISENQSKLNIRSDPKKQHFSPKGNIPVCDHSDQAPSSSHAAASSTTWNFKAPSSFEIHDIVEEQILEVKVQREVNPSHPSDPNESFLDGPSQVVYGKLEDDAYRRVEIKKRKLGDTASDGLQDAAKPTLEATPPAAQLNVKCTATASELKSNQYTSQQFKNLVELQQALTVPISTLSSGTLSYQPAPRRILKPTTAMQPPFINEGEKLSFKCSKEVSEVYGAVCRFSNLGGQLDLAKAPKSRTK